MNKRVVKVYPDITITEVIRPNGEDGANRAYPVLVAAQPKASNQFGAVQRIAASNGFAAMAAFVSVLCFELAGTANFKLTRPGVARRRCKWRKCSAPTSR
jgi:hypothetical protein